MNKAIKEEEKRKKKEGGHISWARLEEGGWGVHKETLTAPCAMVLLKTDSVI